ncbi:hypothetical protein ACK3SF_00040 [Candidatus Nanosalina sp. VS9-1]|uniref:hypothetical protein n=1 Tax=Candidatus Nanosalina sp. VS9-1 TaxID=3388566 RepID=UPI0039DF2E07
MVKFEEPLQKRSDHFFVKEDPVRIYRGLRDILVNEFDVDRIEKGKNEFNVSKPKDRLRLHAFKEKSTHTVIHWRLSWKAKAPKDIYKMDRPDDILKARVQTSGEVVTVYPGANSMPVIPKKKMEYPQSRIDNSGLQAEEKTAFQRSKLYKIMVGIWYNKFYSKEIEKYEEEGDETIIHLHNLMREKFGVEPGIAKTGASEFTPPWR